MQKMEATIQDKIEFYDREAARIQGRIVSEIESLIEDMQGKLEGIEMRGDTYLPPSDGLIRNYANRIDTECARLAAMREMLNTLKG